MFHALEPSFYGGVCAVYTQSGDYPYGYEYCQDAFAAALNPSGSALVYSTYLNGPVRDWGNAVAVDAQGAVYVAGSGSVLFPVSTPVSNGGSAFVVKLGVPRMRPLFTSDSVTNAASFVSGLVPPGGIASVFCSGLTGISGVIQASQLPLPSEIRGVSVKVGGLSAPLFAVADMDGRQQINFQVPFSVASLTGVIDVEVWQNGVVAAVIPGRYGVSPPGVFATDGVYGSIQHADYRLVTGSSPADREEVVILYATGLGEVTPQGSTGSAASATRLATTNETPSVTIGGRPAVVLFSGLTPGSVGLYQLNVRVPKDAPSGDPDVVVSLPPVMDYYVPNSRGSVIFRRDSKPVKISVR
jgi:uncharacterized protein (TIGR03437 family)